MGHETSHRSFPEKTPFEKMHAFSEEWARRHVDYEENPSGSYGNRWLKHTGIILDSLEDAEEYLDRQGAYVDGCVRYKEPELKDTKKSEKIREQIKRQKELRDKFDKDHDIRKAKATLISCRRCKSKIARNYIRSARCPVCGEDLRAEYIPEKLNAYTRKIRELEMQLDEARKSNKYVVKWLVKTEVHC